MNDFEMIYSQDQVDGLQAEIKQEKKNNQNLKQDIEKQKRIIFEQDSVILEKIKENEKLKQRLEQYIEFQKINYDLQNQNQNSQNSNENTQKYQQEIDQLKNQVKNLEEQLHLKEQSLKALYQESETKQNFQKKKIQELESQVFINNNQSQIKSEDLENQLRKLQDEVSSYQLMFNEIEISQFLQMDAQRVNDSVKKWIQENQHQNLSDDQIIQKKKEEWKNKLKNMLNEIWNFSRGTFNITFDLPTL